MFCKHACQIYFYTARLCTVENFFEYMYLLLNTFYLNNSLSFNISRILAPFPIFFHDEFLQKLFRPGKFNYRFHLSTIIISFNINFIIKAYFEITLNFIFKIIHFIHSVRIIRVLIKFFILSLRILPNIAG